VLRRGTPQAPGDLAGHACSSSKPLSPKLRAWVDFLSERLFVDGVK